MSREAIVVTPPMTSQRVREIAEGSPVNRPR
jgi:hypothetical protein